MKSIFKCKACQIYTMKEICPKCNIKAGVPRPPKYSPEDKYGKYRRATLLEERKKQGLL